MCSLTVLLPEPRIRNVKQPQMDDAAMTIDNDRIDDAALALLHLGLHDKYRAWKGFDWDAMNRLYEKGYISDPWQSEIGCLHRRRHAAVGRTFPEDVCDKGRVRAPTLWMPEGVVMISNVFFDTLCCA